MGVRGSHMWMCKLLLLRGATGGTKMPSLWWLKRIRSVVIDILSNFPICYKVRSLAFLCRGCITKWNTNVPRWAQRGRRDAKSWFQMEACRGMRWFCSSFAEGSNKKNQWKCYAWRVTVSFWLGIQFRKYRREKEMSSNTSVYSYSREKTNTISKPLRWYSGFWLNTIKDKYHARRGYQPNRIINKRIYISYLIVQHSYELLSFYTFFSFWLFLISNSNTHIIPGGIPIMVSLWPCKAAARYNK